VVKKKNGVAPFKRHEKQSEKKGGHRTEDLRGKWRQTSESQFITGPKEENSNKKKKVRPTGGVHKNIPDEGGATTS